MSNDNKQTGTEEIVDRGMRTVRNETLAGAIEICEIIAKDGGSAADCVRSLTSFRDRFRDAPLPAKEVPR